MTVVITNSRPLRSGDHSFKTVRGEVFPGRVFHFLKGRLQWRHYSFFQARKRFLRFEHYGADVEDLVPFHSQGTWVPHSPGHIVGHGFFRYLLDASTVA